MKVIVLSGVTSGVGKTSLTVGLMAAARSVQSHVADRALTIFRQALPMLVAHAINVTLSAGDAA